MFRRIPADQVFARAALVRPIAPTFAPVVCVCVCQSSAFHTSPACAHVARRRLVKEIVDPQSAARLAAEATAALRRVEGAAPRGKSVGGGAGNSGSTADAEVEELREEERRLLARLAARGTAGLPPSAAKEVERLSAEIAELKAGLAAEGLTEGEQDKEERVLPRLVRLAELQQSQRHDKKQERRDREELEGIRGEVELLRAKVDAHKRGLREEGLTSKEVRQDAQVGDLEERLATLRRMGGA